MATTDILAENRDYWSKRAATYSSDIRRDELSHELGAIWLDTISGFITSQFPDRAPEQIHVLDIGTGPGFFAIILAKAGYQVTAIDLTPSMLAEARQNAGPLTGDIRFLEMNAQELAFADASFDVIVTRNLTWDLPDPELAYREWHRVLKSGSLLLNFDANWYRYLVDDDAKTAYDTDRINADAIGLPHENPDVDYGIMEEIAAKIPMTQRIRPAWDIDYLTTLGFHAKAHDNIWEKVWSEEDKIAYASTPMFLVHATKQ